MRIKREKVSNLVLEEIKKMIKSGEFPPNSKLPSETELAKMFGVSRSPIREALSVLAASGLVESTQGGGSWVREVSLAEMLEPVQFEMVEVEQVQDLLEMRTIIESEAAFLAAKRHKPKDIEDLEEALEAFRKVSEDQFKIGYEEDYAFHRIIVRAAYNPFLTQTMDHLSELHLKAMMFSLEKNLGWEAKRQEVFMEHVHIFNAIKNRDSQAARDAVIEHLTNARIKLGDKRVSKL
ncbi:GntR family transcriptional repressor for pyruvate dehydrogenase complex [Bacillus oleivorans]|uniref:GntR family transcriptional repressor for pyruvate dehydrogenase complex n=1 Tax=Bacillus oleivorans TaxID=1448271 RepID=A0A285CPX9_9BACI|nr:FadR/GntR family transcriptional regulator [Bacillus oleivorans]SNX69619.1 GntR family transcriptional repressor for pyruvate dehydrogenase complex [Bacillus oleivorans]